MDDVLDEAGKSMPPAALLSNCCGAPALANTDLCSACKEHAEFFTDEEWAEQGQLAAPDALQAP